ncbi:hypothetical protein DIPPA_01114 [Diplonema papillatum]|nr:hypothetical protein DIPPA_01114 [Diplonema papillatum]
MIGGSACDFDDDSTSDSEQSYPQAAGDSFPTGDAKATPHACPTVPSTASQASDLTPQRASHPDVGGFDHESSFTEDHKKDALASHTGSLPYHRCARTSLLLLSLLRQPISASLETVFVTKNVGSGLTRAHVS